MKTCIFVCVLLAQSILLYSQADTVIILDEVEIKSLKTNTDKMPVSASSIDSNQLIGLPSLSINESIHAFAGIIALSPNNFAQDSRISSRGFGARSAFGIRGIKILMDGIPESTPDGQAQLDDIDFSNLHTITLVRGPQAGIYGNSSGGVLQLNSPEPGNGPMISIASKIGSNGLSRYRLGSDFKLKKFACSASFSQINYSGFREWSEYENRILSLNLKFEPSPKHRFEVLVSALDNPRSNDPGALTLDEVNTHPMSARDRNIQYKAGESIRQIKGGIIYNLSTSTKKNWLTIRNYVVLREFENYLPFAAGGAVTINRTLNGTSLDFNDTFILGKLDVRVDAGIEYENQIDRRNQYENKEGRKGDLNFDQDEIFQNYSAYLLANTTISSKISLFTTLRYDRILTKANDYFLQNGDQSGQAYNSAINSSIGLNFELRPTLHINLLYSTGFENPTLIELSNNPSGLGGLNSGLQPMRSRNVEANVKYNLLKRSYVKMSLFHINSKDEITSYEIDGQSGRSYYRNAGQTQRSGLELELNGKLGSRISMNGNYTFSKFTYEDYLAYDGKALPGLPRHMAYLEFDIEIMKKLTMILNNRYVGKIYLDDTNMYSTPHYFECNVRTSYFEKIRRFGIHFTAGLNNVLNTFYYSNVRINAVANRYYEAAPSRQAYVGLELSF